MKTYLYREVYHHFSGLSFIAEVNFWRPPKTVVSCDLFINIIIIIINFFRRVFFEYTEATATSLIPLDIILPEICAFIVGFSCTLWTKMTSLACSLADGVLADTILISPCPQLPPTNIRKARGRQKKLVTDKPYTVEPR